MGHDTRIIGAAARSMRERHPGRGGRCVSATSDETDSRRPLMFRALVQSARAGGARLRRGRIRGSHEAEGGLAVASRIQAVGVRPTRDESTVQAARRSRGAAHTAGVTVSELPGYGIRSYGETG